MVTFPEALRPRAKHLRASALAAAVAALLLTGCNDEKKSQQAAPPPPGVGVVAVHAQDVTLIADLPGRTAASLVAEVRPQVDGIIRERLFAEGGEVKAGEVLYRIDASRYQAAYDAAQAALHQAEAAVPSAAARVERYKKLAQANAVSRQDLEDAEATLKANRAAVAAARAEVESALINLDYTDITAPIAGRIDRSIYTQGALVTASQSAALTTIRKIDPVHVDVTQSSSDLLRLRRAVEAGRIKRVGGSIEVKLRLEDGSVYAHPGTLAFAEANVSETTGTYILRATFPNPERLLLPGMYVHAIVAEGVAEKGILVPQRGVSRNLKGEPIAMVVKPDDTVEVRVLNIARSIGNDWLVESGLADGDRVIVSGSQRARQGGKVTPEAMVIDPATGEAKKAGEPAPAKG